MRSPLVVCAVLTCLAVCQFALAATWTVTDLGDSGTGSLRWAIDMANGHAGPDTVTFDASLAGKTISPLTVLPTLTDGATTIDGDLDDNAMPDITLSGANLSSGSGLRIESLVGACKIVGLAIVSFPTCGVHINESGSNAVLGCHIGVSASGSTAAVNGGDDVLITDSSGNVIGGPLPSGRNVIAGGNSASGTSAGVNLVRCTSTRIERNHLGLKRNGMDPLDVGNYGVIVSAGSGNTIGGGGTPGRNLFGGLKYGVLLTSGTYENVITGNHFGVAKDGATALPLVHDAVVIQISAHDNRVGGFTPKMRNVFASSSPSTTYGVRLWGTTGNWILGNYFGLTADGSAVLPLRYGVAYESSAGINIIGGSTDKTGNYFASGSSGAPFPTAVCFRSGGGAGSTVRSNVFGLLPNGTGAPGLTTAIDVDQASVKVLDNTIARVENGLRIRGAANPKAMGNLFKACQQAVRLEAGARARLGNLGNSSAGDDGGNLFRSSNTWHVYSESAYGIKAEGNAWGSTVCSEIDAKIHDKLDDGSLGRVDFIPLLGGIVPSGGATPALTLTSASAAPTALGAEIAFCLSAPAEVTVEVLNVAGRPVAVVAVDRPAAAGLQRLLWNGLSDQGLRAPRGTYLVRITARDATGTQVTGLTRANL